MDNASQDGSRSVLADYRRRIRVIENSRNVGFAAGQNQAIAESRGGWVLTLNPDVLLSAGFIHNLVDVGERESGAGAVCGKLLRIGRDLCLPSERRIDSTGVYFTPQMRHFDRGWNEPDDGRYGQAEFVFGASAAAALYRRDMIDEISLEDGFFDPDFFVYREDADVAWRAQLLGWSCIYTPRATAHHVRGVPQGPRRGVPPLIRMHSVKNRFLMRLKNITGDLYLRHWLEATARDLVVIGGCLVTEPSSLPAFWHLARCFRRALAKRRWIMERRKAGDEYLASWFRQDAAPLPCARDSVQALSA